MSYSPTLARWIEPDPTRAEYVDGLDIYQMEESNPVNRQDPTGEATTQPSPPTTNPSGLVKVIINGKIIQVGYTGKGIPTFKQTVQITGTCTKSDDQKAIQQHEMQDHGGKDPTAGPVGDNKTGDPNAPYGGAGQRPNGGDRLNSRLMTDFPGFPNPPYPDDYRGEKSFVTTVLNPDGTVAGTVKWKLIKDDNGAHLEPDSNE